MNTKKSEDMPALSDAEKRMIDSMLNLEKGAPRLVSKDMVWSESGKEQEYAAILQKLGEVNPEALQALKEGKVYSGPVKGAEYFDRVEDNKIFSSLTEGTKNKKKAVQITITWSHLRIAASLIFIVVAGISVYTVSEMLPKSERITSLKDKTRSDTKFGSLSVNHHSEVEYTHSLLSGNTAVHKDGEALYELKPGQSLTIDTKNFQIVLDNNGMVNIYSRNSVERVSPVKGHAQVLGKDGTQYNLSSVEEMRSINSVAVRVIREYPNRAGTWTEGFIVLDDMPLSEVVKEFELVYDVRFSGKIPDIKIPHVYTSEKDSVVAAMNTFLPERYRVKQVSDKEFIIEDTQAINSLI
jgi:hypothetical protein